MSSTSSGDSGTPIDGPYEAGQGTIANQYAKVSCTDWLWVDVVLNGSITVENPPSWVAQLINIMRISCQFQEGSTFAAVDPNRPVLGEAEGGYTADGEIISSQTVSSKTRTVETITVGQRGCFIGIGDKNIYPPFQYKTERDGIVETRVEQKITIQSDGDPIDHDKALAEAIQVGILHVLTLPSMSH